VTDQSGAHFAVCRPDANLTEFQSKFDVVMTGDGPMDYVIQLFEKLVTRPQR